MDITNSVSAAQLPGVLEYDGPCFIVAGPGSGKTRVLTYRILNMLDNGVSGSDIIAVTFTNKAAREIRSRLRELGADGLGSSFIGTFHDICLRMLREWGQDGEASLSVLDRRSDLRVLERVIADAATKEYLDIYIQNNVEDTDNTYGEAITKGSFTLVRAFSERISGFKSKGMLPKDLPSDTDSERLEKIIYEQYQDALSGMGVISYDDILLKTYLLIKNNKNVQQAIWDRFSYVLVDEAQDSNWVQLQLAELWAAGSENICYIGDLDQSIYGWRGAVPEEFKDFTIRHPSAKIIKLEENYRSTKPIVDFCKAIIASNPSEFRGNLFSNKDSAQKVVLYEASSQYDEAAWATELIKKWKEAGNSVAILIRSGWQSQPFERALADRGLVPKVIGGTRYYDRSEIQDALSWLGVMLSPNNPILFERMISSPTRGIGIKKVTNMIDISDQANLDLVAGVRHAIDTNKVRGAEAQAWFQWLDEWDTFCDIASVDSVSAALIYLRDVVKLVERKYSKSYAASLGVFNSFIEDASEYFSNEPNIASTRRGFVEKALLAGSADEDLDKDTVPIATMHAVKGLEFDCVVVAGVENELLPHKKSNNVREERRLLYVACSRAKTNLAVTYARERISYSEKNNPYTKEAGSSYFLNFKIKEMALFIKAYTPNKSYSKRPTK